MSVHRDLGKDRRPEESGGDRIAEAAAFLTASVPEFPDIGVILGSGLGDWVEELPAEARISYAEIPHFPTPSVAGHAGALYVVTLGGRRAAVLSGRVHLYEGASVESAVFPVRALAAAGMRYLITTNAAGGLNPALRVGDFLLIRDHLGFVPRMWSSGLGQTPICGGIWGYDRPMSDHLERVALRNRIRLLSGVLFWFSGPTYETPAEARMVRMLGGDAATMSTLPENVAAWCAGVRSAGLSLITNHVAPEQPTHTRHSDVVSVARKAGRTLRRLLDNALESWDEGVT
jgi:purine-nucleoside phosphorylase